MKLRAISLAIAAASICFAPISSDACTGLRLTAKDGGRVIGRTMEFGFDVESDAVVVPPGTEMSSSLPDKTKGMRYKSKYGIIGANALGKHVVVDGINEKGLYVGAFYFPGYASYASPDSKGRARIFV